MTTSTRKSHGLDHSLKNLSISPSTTANHTNTPIVESWEQQASSSEEDADTRPSTPLNNENEPPGPPPPTPSSPTHFRKRSTDWTSFPAAYSANPRSPTSPSSSSFPDKRPEKSNAAAGRMIAGALGVKAPKKTEEGKAYERAVMEKERKRREMDKEKGAQEEREREEARRAVWDG